MPGSDLPACQFGDITKHGVQVAQAPAEDWAASLPSLAAMLQDNSAGIADPDKLQQLTEAIETLDTGGEISPDEACVLFSQLLELQGLEPGTRVTASYLPTKETALALSAQQCLNGRFTSILVGDPEIGQDPDVVSAVMAILERIG